MGPNKVSAGWKLEDWETDESDTPSEYWGEHGSQIIYGGKAIAGGNCDDCSPSGKSSIFLSKS